MRIPKLTSRVDAAPSDDDRYWRLGRRKLLQVFLRAIVGAALIAFLAWQANLGSVISSLRQATFAYVVLAYVLASAAVFLGAFRWRPFLSSLGFKVAVSATIRLYLIGAFFNAFLPTGVGGDAYKVLRLPRDSGTGTGALASVLLDRAAGVVGMAAVALIGVVSQMASGERGAVLLSASLVGLLVLLTYGVLYAVGGRYQRAAFTPGGAGIREQTRLLLRTVAGVIRDTRTSSHGVGIGVLTCIALLCANVSLAQALHFSVPPGWMAAVLLLASVVATVPLSINGMGLREATYVWGLTSFGIDKDTAFAFALLALGAGLASSAIGGIVYAVAGGAPPEGE